MTDYRNFIGGRFAEPSTSATLDVVNPATGRVFARVPAANDADAILAVQKAAQAQKEWGAQPAINRGDALRRLAEAVQKRAGEIGDRKSTR